VDHEMKMPALFGLAQCSYRIAKISPRTLLPPVFGVRLYPCFGWHCYQRYNGRGFKVCVTDSLFTLRIAKTEKCLFIILLVTESISMSAVGSLSAYNYEESVVLEEVSR